MMNDQAYFETYQQRMSQIQAVHDVVTIAGQQLGKLLDKFDWNKKSLTDKVSLF